MKNGPAVRVRLKPDTTDEARLTADAIDEPATVTGTGRLLPVLR
jgi:hypothetical protein